MTRSRKLIVVLTRNYGNGIQEFELDQAGVLYREGKLEKIIVVKVGDVPAKQVPAHLYAQMKNGMFIEWEENAHATETFICQLKDSLKATPKRVESR